MKKITDYFKALPSKFALLLNVVGVLYSLHFINIARNISIVVKDANNQALLSGTTLPANKIFDFYSESLFPILINILLIFGIARIINLISTNCKTKNVVVEKQSVDKIVPITKETVANKVDTKEAKEVKALAKTKKAPKVASKKKAEKKEAK